MSRQAADVGGPSYRGLMTGTLEEEKLRIVPANQATWADVQAAFGERGCAHGCQCQWFKMPQKEWQSLTVAQREARQRAITNCGDAEAATTGLVAFVDGVPAAWVAVEPRVNYVRMLTQRIPWLGRDEDRADPGVWAISCFATRAGYRRRGLTHELTRAAVDYAREHGATAVEGYPRVVHPGEDVSWGELYVGAVSVFEAAGFREVTRPTERRRVMRLDL